jgi:Asp/Glu/hydantoin racemase
LTVERIFQHDLTYLEAMLKAAKELVREGVRAITGDCGFMAIYQEELARSVEVPVFLTSLLQIPFISKIIGQARKIGVVTASAAALDEFVFRQIGIEDLSALVIRGLEKKPNFASAVIKEEGELDSVKIEAEVVSVAKELVAKNPAVRAVLLECSMLPPYGAAVQEAVGLPVFDFVTMIDYVFSAVVKRRFQGFM